MVELGELESRKDEFSKRNVEVVAVSVDGLTDASVVQEKFPSLRIVSDEALSLAKSFDLVHEGAGMDGEDVATPTTFVLNGKGDVKFLYRSSAVAERLAVDNLLTAIDQSLAKQDI